MKKFTINGKEYTARAYDFGMICDLEDLGVSIDDFADKQMKFVRAYFSVSAGISLSKATEEINQHIIAGGDLSELFIAIDGVLEDSDFFQALRKAAETEVAESPSEQTEKAE